MSVTSRHRVRFCDCDTAGIAYYPRLLAHVDSAVEDWMEETVGIDRAGLLIGAKLGLPTADMQIGFSRPCRLGETIDIGITPTRIGRSSIALAIMATVDGDPRFSGTLIQVLTKLETGSSREWPAEWRASIAAQIPESDETRLAS
jgi:4-hydroxybenzoyl-CoA thioesterase